MTDWTRNEQGRLNDSPLYNKVVEAVAHIIRSSDVGDNPTASARLIVSQITHVHGLVPSDKTYTKHPEFAP